MGHLYHILFLEGSGTTEKESRRPGRARGRAGWSNTAFWAWQAYCAHKPRAAMLPSCRKGSWGLTRDDLWGEEESGSVMGSAPDGLTMLQGMVLYSLLSVQPHRIGGSYYKSIKNLCVWEIWVYCVCARVCVYRQCSSCRTWPSSSGTGFATLFETGCLHC